MKPVVLLAQARRDLKQITFYTMDMWGIEQAERYTYKMHQAFEKLSNMPFMGMPTDEIASGYRKYKAGSHTVFYRVGSSEITVIRIFDQRMNAQEQL